MTIPLFHVDAFTDRPFGGNPAAVCVLEAPRDDRWMQDVAREMNLAATAFIAPRRDDFDLRWFSPTTELEFCGHGTLSSAHVLWEIGRLGAHESARFHARAGILTARRQGDWIKLDFPAEREEPVEAPASLLRALNVAPKYVGRNRLDYLVEVASPDIVRSLAPDMTLLARVETRGVMVTSAASDGPYDFISRFFAPGAGIPEDPVTGSAHCCLGPFWQRRLAKDELIGWQASPRGGMVTVRVSDGRVELGGHAVTVFRARLE